MNKSVFIAFLVLGVLPAFANTSQTQLSESRTQIAPTLGLTSFALRADGFDAGASGGIAVGANSYMPTSIENLDYELGLQYFQTGGKEASFFLVNELTFSYLTAPLGLRWKVVALEEGNFVYLKGGISPSYLVSAKQKVSFLGISDEQNIKDKTNSFDVLAYIGIGSSYAFDQDHKILYELNYVRGTQKVLKDTNSYNEGLVAAISYSMAL